MYISLVHAFKIWHIDVDECAANPCDQNCTNNEGSFVCSCNNGYVLDDDQRTCNGKCITK